MVKHEYPQMSYSAVSPVCFAKSTRMVYVNGLELLQVVVAERWKLSLSKNEVYHCSLNKYLLTS